MGIYFRDWYRAMFPEISERWCLTGKRMSPLRMRNGKTRRRIRLHYISGLYVLSSSAIPVMIENPLVRRPSYFFPSLLFVERKFYPNPDNAWRSNLSGQSKILITLAASGCLLVESSARTSFTEKSWTCPQSWTGFGLGMLGAELSAFEKRFEREDFEREDLFRSWDVESEGVGPLFQGHSPFSRLFAFFLSLRDFSVLRSWSLYPLFLNYSCYVLESPSKEAWYFFPKPPLGHRSPRNHEFVPNPEQDPHGAELSAFEKRIEMDERFRSWDVESEGVWVFRVVILFLWNLSFLPLFLLIIIPRHRRGTDWLPKHKPSTLLAPPPGGGGLFYKRKKCTDQWKAALILFAASEKYYTFQKEYQSCRHCNDSDCFPFSFAQSLAVPDQTPPQHVRCLPRYYRWRSKVSAATLSVLSTFQIVSSVIVPLRYQKPSRYIFEPSFRLIYLFRAVIPRL